MVHVLHSHHVIKQILIKQHVLRNLLLVNGHQQLQEQQQLHLAQLSLVPKQHQELHAIQYQVSMQKLIQFVLYLIMYAQPKIHLY
jgi:hypothetical protein